MSCTRLVGTLFELGPRKFELTKGQPGSAFPRSTLLCRALSPNLTCHLTSGFFLHRLIFRTFSQMCFSLAMPTFILWLGLTIENKRQHGDALVLPSGCVGVLLLVCTLKDVFVWCSAQNCLGFFNETSALHCSLAKIISPLGPKTNQIYNLRAAVLFHSNAEGNRWRVTSAVWWKVIMMVQWALNDQRFLTYLS